MPISGWQQGRVRVVVIDRPDRANAIDLETAAARATLADGEAAGWALNAELAAAVTGSEDAAAR